ncbi:MAG TPA: ATP-binding protein [Longimicrobium sp.]|jgi:ATP-dependent DNA helicase RecG|uniref:ATP-binding protein n=1 Tax=Longimicrobium sp. TaxID=2029185 RepID=UPI002ED87AE5
MGDMLVLAERVRNTIQLGESHFREFKSAYEGKPGEKRPRKWVDICREVGEGLVAFANADGGEILIGVEDDGRISGVPHTEEDLQRILAAPQTHVHRKTALPLRFATSLQIEGKCVLFFSVSKGTQGVFQLPDGRCVRRSGTSTVPESVQKILFDQREARSRAYDTEFVDGAQVHDLDLSLVQAMADAYLRGITAEKYLQQMGLAEYTSGGLRLRRAAVLLFAKDIHRWHPRCQVRTLKVQGTALRAGAEYNVTSDEFVEGNILQLLIRSWEALRPFLAYKTEFGSDARFEQKYIYPEWACREALVNAIAHRDYSIQRSIDVFIFDDRIDVMSPGAILSTLTIDQLLKLEGAHESRNALLARVLREAGNMRELGEGMKRIFELMEQSDLRSPDLATDENSFTVTLYHRSVFSPQQLTWLEMFEGIQLSKNQQRIVIAGIGGQELAPGDIYRAMNSEDRDTYDREVTYLRTAGVLVEIRTNAQANQLAKRTRKPKSSIPRFRVSDPEMLKAARSTPESDRRIAVFNIPLSATEAELEAVFEQFGQIVHVKIPPPKADFYSKFGFVTFAEAGPVQALTEEPIPLTMGQNKLRIETYRERS